MQDSIIINGVNYNSSTLKQDTGVDDLLYTWQKDLHSFILHWFSQSDVITVKTSGSTGKPKSIMVSKLAMIESARRTIEFFGLKPGQSALLCLPVSYIAGKMMVVRAIVGHLNLISVAPSGFPLRDVKQMVDFAAFTPMQMMNELTQKDNSKLQLLRNVIIGGGAVNKHLNRLLINQSFDAYETYGMTETLSHVALRQINGDNPQKNFHLLPGVEIATDKRGCLVLNSSGITTGAITTNDLVEIQADGSFCLTGRYDNIINSGGVKIQPEKIEAVISSFYKDELYASCIPHYLLGEQLVIVVSKEVLKPEELFENIEEAFSHIEQPASLFLVDEFPKTLTGKINRKKLKELILGIKPIFVRSKKINY